MKTFPRAALVFALCGLVVIGITLASKPSAARAAAQSLTGYAWSDNIGWISLSGSNYGLTINANSSLSGYAWSDNIGWISANATDLAGCPSAPCTATFTNGALSGWLKALSADGNGWDGWISLSGSGYGPTIGDNGSFSGYAWGSNVVGWLNFSGTAGATCAPLYFCSGQTIEYTDQYCKTTASTTCTAPAFCSSGSSTCLYPPPQFVAGSGSDGNGTVQLSGNIQLFPSVVKQGTTVQAYWNAENVSSCTITGNGNSWSGASAGCNGTSCTSGAGGKTTLPINQQSVYTLSCTGLDHTSMTGNATVNIIPTFHEQ